jgi:UDP-glucuronate 4-epimerase
MKILVTGGAGFIGSHLVERLLREDHDVCVVDSFDPFYDPQRKRRNLAAVTDHPRFRLHEVDILDVSALRQTFSDAKPERVVHLAARANARLALKEPAAYARVLGEGTINLLELARDFGVEQFVLGSSSSVYGLNAKVPFSEEDPISTTISPYAAGKRAAELFCHVYAHTYGLPVTCLRFFNVHGPRQRPDLAIFTFVRLMLQNEPIHFYGDGTSGRDYTFVDDIIDGVVASLHNIFSYKVINLGGNHPVLLRDMIAEIEHVLGVEARRVMLPPQPGDVPRTYADIRRAGELLGFSPKVSFRDGVERFVAWYKREMVSV